MPTNDDGYDKPNKHRNGIEMSHIE